MKQTKTQQKMPGLSKSCSINTLEYSVPPINDKNLVCTEAGGVSKGGKCEINLYTLLLSL